VLFCEDSTGVETKYRRGVEPSLAEQFTDMSKTCNMFVFTFFATPAVNYSEDSSASAVNHTWAVLRYGAKYVAIDSYSGTYSLRRRVIDIGEHIRTCNDMINSPSSDVWFDLTGVVEDIKHPYELTLESYSVNLDVDILSRLSDICKATVDVIETAVAQDDDNNIYLDDVMCMPLGYTNSSLRDTGAFAYEACLDVLKSLVLN